MLAWTFTVIAVMALASFAWARHRALGFRHAASGAGGRSPVLHSLPLYHGAYAASWALLPSMIVVLIWTLTQDSAINALILSTLPDGRTEGRSTGEIGLLISEIRQLAAGRQFRTPEPDLLAAAQRLNRWTDLAGLAMLSSAAAMTALGAAVAITRATPDFRARNRFEGILTGLMMFSSAVAVLTTLGIIAALVFESFAFFRQVPALEFLFGLRWEPQIAIRQDQVAGLGAFGAVPVFAGTLLIAVVALAVAVPIGLLSALYLAEYANGRIRSVIKPALEVLSGVPTVVYGFFAVLIVAPALVTAGTALGLDVAPNSAIAAGSVMGIMIIPFISSLSDDALNAVPNSLRDGSYALGATQGETIVRVLIPAALPGIAGGVLLALSRAIGETMIVVMAAGLIARLTANPFEGVTTVTVQIVTLLTGDTEFDNPKTLSAFALGLVLFAVTLTLNVIALRIVQTYRERYE